MTEMYYNIVFKSDNGDIWTYQDDYGRDAAFYSLKDAKEKIKEFFKDPLVVEATIHATARQRAEAFLRTLGKWEKAK